MASKVLVKSAFRRFVGLVGQIDAVRSVVALDEDQRDVFTYIKQRDDEICKEVFQAQDIIHDEFPGVLFDFHIVFLDGRHLDDFVRPLPPLTFSKDLLAKGGCRSKLREAEWIQCCALRADGQRCQRAVLNPPYPSGHYKGWHPLCWQHREEIARMLAELEPREREASFIAPTKRRYIRSSRKRRRA